MIRGSCIVNCMLGNTHQLKNEEEDTSGDGDLNTVGTMDKCIVSIDELYN